jgi:hypothetical protein
LRREWDSNPRNAHHVLQFSRLPHSTALPSLQDARFAPGLRNISLCLKSKGGRANARPPCALRVDQIACDYEAIIEMPMMNV